MCTEPSLCIIYWNFVTMYPGNLLDIRLVGFVDTLNKSRKANLLLLECILMPKCFVNVWFSWYVSATCLKSWFSCTVFQRTLTALCLSIVNRQIHVAIGAQSQNLKCFRLGSKVCFSSHAKSNVNIAVNVAACLVAIGWLLLVTWVNCGHMAGQIDMPCTYYESWSESRLQVTTG